MKEWIKNNKKILLFVIYVTITLLLIYFHENWRDEAQSWLIARDCDLFELINEMKYEGHFLLWYLILIPFAKLGFPYITSNIISLMITSISVWLILDKAPFKFYKKVLLIFTFPLLYLFPIVSRCYCLIPLAIVLMSIFYKDRKEKPLIYLLSVVLLANTHVIMLGMVGIVLLDYCIEFFKDSKKISVEEKNKRIRSFIVTIVLLMISFLPLLGCLGTNREVGITKNFGLDGLIVILSYPWLLISQIYNFFYSNSIVIILILILSTILLLFEIKKYPMTYLRIILCVMWQCIIYSFIFISSTQKASTIIFILLYYKWINSYDKKKKSHDIEKKIINIFWIVLATINIMGGVLYIAIYEIPYNSSNAYQIGNYINENISDNSIILTGPRVEFTSGVVPYTKKGIKYYHIPGKRYISYTIWDDKNKVDIKMDDIKELVNIFGKDQKLYYIYCNDKYDVGVDSDNYKENELIDECIDKEIFKEVYSTNEKSIYKENYTLYEIDLNKI